MFKDKNGQFSAGKLIAFIAAIVAVIIVAASCFTVVPAGHTGVVVNMGRVSETVLQEGFHFKTPFVQEIVQIDNRIVKLEVATDAFSKDLQTVSTVLAVNYRIAKDMSYSIYKEVGSNFESVLVMPAVNEVLKAVVAKYTASDLVASRSEVSVMLDEELNGKLNARGIFIEDLNIIDWDFSAEYIAAVEAKQVAEQNLIKTKTEQEEQIVDQVARRRAGGGSEEEAHSRRGRFRYRHNSRQGGSRAHTHRGRGHSRGQPHDSGIVKRCNTAQQNNRKMGRSASPRYHGRRLHAHDIRSHGVSI